VIRKSFEAVETKAIDADRGLYSCIFSATKNEDRQGDEIDPGAFAKALAAKASVPVVYAHVWNDIHQVLGRTDGWKELAPGDPELPAKLLTKGLGGVKANIQYEMDVPAGRVAATHTKNGNITDWSFAFDIDDDGEKYVDNVRHIKSIKEIYEVTLALIGANPATTTMAFKAMVEAESLAEHDDEAELIPLLHAAAILLAD
jgi:HK97 family phage prohead protease